MTSCSSEVPSVGMIADDIDHMVYSSLAGIQKAIARQKSNLFEKDQTTDKDVVPDDAEPSKLPIFSCGNMSNVVRGKNDCADMFASVPMNSESASSPPCLSMQESANSFSIEVLQDPVEHCANLQNQLNCLQRSVIEPLEEELEAIKTNLPPSDMCAILTPDNDEYDDFASLRSPKHIRVVNDIHYQLEDELEHMQDSLETPRVEWRANYAYHLEKFRQMYGTIVRKYRESVAIEVQQRRQYQKEYIRVHKESKLVRSVLGQQTRTADHMMVENQRLLSELEGLKSGSEFDKLKADIINLQFLLKDEQASKDAICEESNQLKCDLIHLQISLEEEKKKREELERTELEELKSEIGRLQETLIQEHEQTMRFEAEEKAKELEAEAAGENVKPLDSEAPPVVAIQENPSEDAESDNIFDELRATPKMNQNRNNPSFFTLTSDKLVIQDLKTQLTDAMDQQNRMQQELDNLKAQASEPPNPPREPSRVPSGANSQDVSPSYTIDSNDSSIVSKESVPRRYKGVSRMAKSGVKLANALMDSLLGKCADDTAIMREMEKLHQILSEDEEEFDEMTVDDFTIGEGGSLVTIEESPSEERAEEEDIPAFKGLLKDFVTKTDTYLKPDSVAHGKGGLSSENPSDENSEENMSPRKQTGEAHDASTEQEDNAMEAKTEIATNVGNNNATKPPSPLMAFPDLKGLFGAKIDTYLSPKSTVQRKEAGGSAYPIDDSNAKEMSPEEDDPIIATRTEEDEQKENDDEMEAKTEIATNVDFNNAMKKISVSVTSYNMFDTLPSPVTAEDHNVFRPYVTSYNIDDDCHKDKEVVEVNTADTIEGGTEDEREDPQTDTSFNSSYEEQRDEQDEERDPPPHPNEWLVERVSQLEREKELMLTESMEMVQSAQMACDAQIKASSSSPIDAAEAWVE